jgi:hypothetical protein
MGNGTLYMGTSSYNLLNISAPFRVDISTIGILA